MNTNPTSKAINLIGEAFFNRGLFIKALVVIIALFYSNEIVTLIYKYLLPQSFKNVERGPLYNVSSGIIFLVAVSFYIYAFARNYRPNLILNWAVVVLSAYHFYFRIIEKDTWSYAIILVYKNYSFAYLDLLFAICSVHLSLLCKNTLSKNEQPQNSSGLSVDESYSKKGVDELNRTALVELIVEQIRTHNDSKSFAVGIVGGWGFGKTYFMDMLREHFEKEDNFIVVRFNPWNCIGEGETIAISFFDTLKSTLSKFNGNVSKEINSYMKRLVSMDQTGLIEETLSTHTSLQDEFDKIDECIKKIGRKVIVFIDDLDRLDSNEILELLKLVRNNADFANTFFIAGYDKMYLTHALSKINSYQPHIYLEKIFQLEIELPIIRKEVLKRKAIELVSVKTPELKEKFEHFFDIVSFEESSRIALSSDEELDVTSFSNFELFVTFISNFRDINRLQNALSIDYKLNLQEIVFTEWLLITILRIKHQGIYDALRRKSFLTTRFIHETNQSLYSINETKLDSVFKQLGLNLYNQELCSSLLRKLFARTEKQARNSIKVVDSFELYFDAWLFNKVSLVDFNHIRQSSFEKIEDFMDEWIKTGKKDDLIEILTSQLSFNNKQDFENIVNMIFYLGALKFYEIRDLLMLFNKDRLSEVSKLYYESDDELKRFLTGKIADSTLEDGFSLSFLHHAVRKSIYEPSELFFTLEEIQEIALARLEKIIDHYNSTEVGKDQMTLVFQYYYVCIDDISDDDKKVIILPQANDQIKKFIEDHPSAFIEFNIRPVYTPHDGETYTIEPFIPQIFGSYPEFETFLKSQKIITSYLLELITFYNEFKKAKFQAIKHTRGTIRIISDESVRFIGSETYTDLQPKNVMSFTTPLTNDLKNTSLSYANLVADRYPISDTEANRGGYYKLQLKVNIPKELAELSNRFEAYVDDYLTITVNGNLILEDFHGKDAVTYKKNNLKLLEGENVFDFIIRNVSREEIDPMKSLMKGIENPYALIFCLTIQDNKIKQSEDIALSRKN